MLFIHFQDFVDAYVGPFETADQCTAHVKFCQDRGDSAAHLGNVTELPADAFVTSPEEDRAWPGGAGETPATR